MAAVSTNENTLVALIYQASELNNGATRLDAVKCLKELSVTREMAHELCDLLVAHEHPAVRTAVAQVLGCHRVCARFGEVKAELLRRAQNEADLLGLQGLFFALRNTDGVLAFFAHECDDVCIEAVIGVPVVDLGLQALLDGVVGKTTDAVAWAMCEQLSRFSDITPNLVACLMAKVKLYDNFDERALLLFKKVPQVELLDALTDVSGEIERTYQTIWPGIWRREQQKRLLAVFVALIAQMGASKALVEMLVQRVSQDAEFYGRYLRFVRTLIAELEYDDAVSLVDLCAVVGEKSDRECLSRLAEVLVEVAGRVPKVADRVLDTLGRWEVHLPGVRLKAFHARR